MVQPPDSHAPAPHPPAAMQQSWSLDAHASGHDDEPFNKAFALVYDSSTEADDTEIHSFKGFHAPLWKTCCFYALGICTFGVSWLLAKWSPAMLIWLSLSPCPLGCAQYVLIRLTDGRRDLERVTRLPGAGKPGAPLPPRPPPARPAPGSKDVEEGRRPLLEGQQGEQELLFEDEEFLPEDEELLVEYRCNRYFYARAQDTFRPVPAMPRGFTQQVQRAAQQLAAVGGSRSWQPELSASELQQRRRQYGTNEMCIPVKSVTQLILDEMWHPFYVFQHFSILVWVLGDAYYSYAVCIAAITWFSIISSAIEAHRNMARLADIAHFQCSVQVLRPAAAGGGGAAAVAVTLPSSALVPGDVLLLRAGGAMPCDAVLLRGECIVDENMLTGESVPVRKVPYSPTAIGLGYSPDKDATCTLYGGTLVAQARAARGRRALAVVCRTRFHSAKGQLLRSILFPRAHQQAFVNDSLLFILFMLSGCLALYVWAAVVLKHIGASDTRILVRFFDMITIAVPPALPACLTIATVFSITRFRKRGVFVTSPDRIAAAGQLDVICFDKTGTLTEQGLELQGIIPVSSSAFQPITAAVPQLPQQLQQLLASCHGLALMDGALVGDPLDQKLFLATHWQLIDVDEADEEEEGGAEPQPPRPLEAAKQLQGGEPNGAAGGGRGFGESSRSASTVSVSTIMSASPMGPAVDYLSADHPGDPGAPRPPPQREDLHHHHHHHHVHTYLQPPGAVAGAPAFSIVKRFEFSSALQRNVVVVRAPEGGVAVFAKGSPEAIRALVDPHSVPPDFDAVLAGYTREGLRVLALAAGDAGTAGVASAMVASAAAPPLAAWSQDEVERRVPLSLVGLAVMVNPLRADSADVVRQLQAASIRTAMVTGDHLHTAVSVAHLCGIMPAGRPVVLVDAAAPAPAGPPPPLLLSVLYPDGTISALHSAAEAVAAVSSSRGEYACAVTGKGFSQLMECEDHELVLACLTHASVYARMSPDNKRDLMGMLGDGLDWMEGGPCLGLHVGFCGDGANDCGALKASHVGVSLCEAEASVAAPMTSKSQSTAAMLTVVAEGRCSLMATFQIFQFIIGYALVQAFETNLCYTYALNVGNFQYLIQDLFFTTVLAALMGYTEPRSKLSRFKPLSRVMSLPLMVSTLLQLLVIMTFQVLALWLLSRQPGYAPTLGTPDLRLAQAPENTVTYLMALGQFIILALVFNKGRPHRSPLYTNVGLLVALVVQASFLLFSLFSDDAFNREVQELVGMDGVVDGRFRVVLLLLILANSVTAFAMEALSRGLVACMQQGSTGHRARSKLAAKP